MADINLKEYLKNVAELEGSVYNQERAIVNCQQTFESNKPKKTEVAPVKEIPMPKALKEKGSVEWKRIYQTKDSRDEVAKNWATAKKLIKIGCLVSFGSFVLFYLLAFAFSDVDAVIAVSVIGMLIGMVIGLAIILIGAVKFGNTRVAAETLSGSAYEFDEARYQRDLAAYEAAIAGAETARQEEQTRWEEEEKKANADYDEKRVLHRTNQDETLKRLASSLEETRKILAAYYAKGVIFEKYRNLVAMTTIYEYFASGRCSELEGPNGAYNLYEQETRQDVVITNLQEINKNLGRIQNNQYVLFKTMNEGVESLRKIQSDVTGMATCVKNIEKSSAISAYCSKIMAENEVFQSAMMLYD